MNPKVALVLGSDSDYPVVEDALKILDDFGIPCEVTVSSAHRSPDRTQRYAATLEERGIEVVIACAGGAAQLAGVLAAHTSLAVAGVRTDCEPPQHRDRLRSTLLVA